MPANSSVTSSSSVGSVFLRALTARSEWPDKEEFLDVVYWARQGLGVLLGLIFGVIGITGAFGIVGFAAINAVALYVYCSAFQSVDDEEYGGTWELTKEGFLTSFAGFLVSWIIIYSGLHTGQSL